MTWRKIIPIVRVTLLILVTLDGLLGTFPKVINYNIIIINSKMIQVFKSSTIQRRKKAASKIKY